MTSIYVSYPNEDIENAKAIQQMLQNNGINAYLVDHTNFNPNGDVAMEMLSLIKQSDALLCLFSANANASNFISIELNAAVKREKKVYLYIPDHTKIDKKNNFVTANSVILKSSNLKNAVNELLLINGKGENNG